MDIEPESSVRLFSYHEDQPNEERGALIPRSLAVDEVIIEQEGDSVTLGTIPFLKLTMVPVGVAAFLFVAFAGFSAVTTGGAQYAAPIISIFDPYTNTRSVIEYGPVQALQTRSLFAETQAALVDDGQTFLSVDLEESVLRLFENGVLVVSEPIESAPEKGSWWDVPSGLYQVQSLEERKYSTYTQTVFPWSVTFEGNYVIHGWPQLASGEEVSSEAAVGGIRVDDDAARMLHDKVTIDTPVLIRAQQENTSEAFVYETPAENVSAAHYLAADIENGAVLLASDVSEAVPIASITKLMTALVAAEKIDLNKRVFTESPTFVESLVPRLEDRTSVSMYGLLQLLLLESSNEAAEVIAAEYGRADFIAEMNQKAKVIGMFDTTFADPSGLSQGNVSSLQDLFLLTRYLYEQRSFILEITKDGDVNGLAATGEFTDLYNFNVLDTLDGFEGGKVGETSAAGLTSVSLHRVNIQGNERTVAVILLNSQARQDDVSIVLQQIVNRYNGGL